MEGEIPAEQARSEDGFFQAHWQKLLAAVVWAAIAGGVLFFMWRNGLGATDLLRELVALMQTPAGPLIYIAIYAARPLLFFSAVVLTLASGALFGPLWGIFYTLVGSNLSAAVAYGMGRVLGGGLLAKSKESGTLQRYTERMQANSFETTLVMRFIFLPYDLVSYLAGFLRISFRSFILATALGSLPGTISFVLAGASLRVEELFEPGARPSLDPWTLAISVLLFLVSLGLSRVLRRRDPASNGETSHE